MDVIARLGEMIDQAVRAARARRWGEAARHYEAGARLALEHQLVQPARRSFEAAGEAWRRADFPQPAVSALRAALALPQEDQGSAAVNKVRLASVLAECGNGAAALQLCEEAAREAEGPARAVVIDSHIGTLFGFGRKEPTRPLVAALEDPLARGFREGQLLRLDGELRAARSAFEGVAEKLRETPMAEAGLAAAWGEIAEVNLLDGSANEAVEGYEAASEAHRVSGRRALAWRCEAGRIRAMVEAGLEVLPTALEAGISHAEAHGAVLLQMDLRLAKGVALAARDPLRAEDELLAVARWADEAGSRLRAGRSRLELATRVLGAGSRRQGTLREALALLEDSVPHADRARRALEGG